MLIDILPGSMLGPEMNAGLEADSMCGAGSVPGPDFGENLTSLLDNIFLSFWKRPVLIAAVGYRFGSLMQ